MLENIKYIISLKTIDKLIKDANYDLALEKLNFLVQENFMPSETFLKRGKLCKKLLMYEDAYSDFTYIITHCVKKNEAYYERMLLSFEMSNYAQAIADADSLSEIADNDSEIFRIKFLSYIFSEETEIAKNFALAIFQDDRYKVIHYLLTECAKYISENELAKSLTLLSTIDTIDRDNPLKLYNEAIIYGLAGQKDKESEILKKIDSIFPKYFISHFRFTDIYEDRNLMEIYFLLELKIFDKQDLFAYPMSILEGYKNYMEGHITDSKECFERAISINPTKPDGYVLLAEILQLMSGYDNPDLKKQAEQYYKKAMELYEKDNLIAKVENMKRQIKHLNSTLSLN